MDSGGVGSIEFGSGFRDDVGTRSYVNKVVLQAVVQGLDFGFPEILGLL